MTLSYNPNFKTKTMAELDITDKQLEQIETELLQIMNSCDKASQILWDANEFLDDAQKITLIKKDIKIILNKRYDNLARRKLKTKVVLQPLVTPIYKPLKNK